MMPMDEVFAPSQVITDNIALIEKEQSLAEEKRICELSALAGEAADHLLSLAEGGMPTVDVLSLLSFDTERAPVLHDNAMEASGKHLAFHAGLLSSLDRTVLCSLLYEALKKRGICPTEADFLPPASSPETFTYVKNFYADEAYDVFSDAFSDPRVFYSETLRDAVLAVSEGRAGYCLLPLEEKGGTRLASVSELLYKSELRIASVTPVYGYGEENDLTYALISRGFLIPELGSDVDRYLELRLPKDAASLPELLFAAEACGAQVFRIHTQRSDGGGERSTHYSLVLRTEGLDFSTLLIYLSVFVKEFTPIGIYASLES